MQVGEIFVLNKLEFIITTSFGLQVNCKRRRLAKGHHSRQCKGLLPRRRVPAIGGIGKKLSEIKESTPLSLSSLSPLFLQTFTTYVISYRP